MDRKPEVLDFLKIHGEASLSEVAAHLGITKQGALRHLEGLDVSGLVTMTPSNPGRPGRPEHRYRLTDSAEERFPHAHRQLARELVEFISKDELERFFTRRSANLELGYRTRLQGRSLVGKLQELSRATTEEGHMSEVGIDNDQLRLRHHNCPIQDIAIRTAHPCEREREMYGRLLGAAVERSTWLGSGDSCCTYKIDRQIKKKEN
ncbi:MAG: helix-turn-helix transcriptional regulator, partial [Candidatus Dormibacteraceae bacterium]